MTHLVDTNVLLRFVDRTSPTFPLTRRAISTLMRRGDRLVTTSQNLAEFWNVSTRPTAVNGLGRSVVQAERWLRRVERFFSVLPDNPQTYPTWRRLVVTHARGDARRPRRAGTRRAARRRRARGGGEPRC